jgi:hypothetical protein
VEISNSVVTRHRSKAQHSKHDVFCANLDVLSLSSALSEGSNLRNTARAKTSLYMDTGARQAHRYLAGRLESIVKQVLAAWGVS